MPVFLSVVTPAIACATFIALGDASGFSAWDKVGIVGVLIAVISVLVGLHRAGLKRVDAISDRHMEFVEVQTKIITQLVESNKERNDSNLKLHERLDRFLECRQPRCPVNSWLQQKRDKSELLAGPKGPLP